MPKKGNFTTAPSGRSGKKLVGIAGPKSEEKWRKMMVIYAEAHLPTSFQRHRYGIHIILDLVTRPRVQVDGIESVSTPLHILSTSFRAHQTFRAHSWRRSFNSPPITSPIPKSHLANRHEGHSLCPRRRRPGIPCGRCRPARVSIESCLLACWTDLGNLIGIYHLLLVLIHISTSWQQPLYVDHS